MSVFTVLYIRWCIDVCMYVLMYVCMYIYIYTWTLIIILYRYRHNRYQFREIHPKLASDLTLPALEPASVIDRTPLSCQLDQCYMKLYAVLEKKQEQTTSPVLKSSSFLLTLTVLLLVSPELVTYPHDFCFILDSCIIWLCLKIGYL